MTCPNAKEIIILGMNRVEKQAILFNPRCKLWSCDYCAELNKEFWIHQATRGAILITTEGRKIQFVTLTSRPYATPTTGLYFLKKNWPLLNRKLKYHTDKWRAALGYEWAYFMVPEHHKSGVVHCHLFAATHYDTVKSWKDFAFSSGFGWRVDVQPLITPEQAASYVAKYLHKGHGAEQWPKGFRRVRHSQNWPVSEMEPPLLWDFDTVSEETAWLEKNALLNLGWQVRDKRESETGDMLPQGNIAEIQESISGYW